MSKELRRRNAPAADGISRLAWTAQRRLHRRHHHLLHNGKSPQQAVVAVARELVGFIWAVGQEQEWLKPAA